MFLTVVFGGTIIIITTVLTMDRWHMDDEQLKLRQQALLILFREFGQGKYSQQSIYECADEWISKGHKITNGIVAYYRAYYKTKAAV